MTFIRHVSAALTRISTRVSPAGQISSRDKSTLDLLWHNFNAEPISFLNDPQALGKLEELCASFSSPLASPADALNYWPADIECGLDELHELDWDTEGIELSPSSNSFTSPQLAVSESFASHCSVLYTAHMQNSGYSEADSGAYEECYSPYGGTYEKEMEMSLELEDEFSEDEELKEYKHVALTNEFDQESSKTLVTDEHAIESIGEQLPVISVEDGRDRFKLDACNYHLVSIDEDQSSLTSNHSSLLKRYAPIDNLSLYNKRGNDQQVTDVPDSEICSVSLALEPPTIHIVDCSINNASLLSQKSDVDVKAFSTPSRQARPRKVIWIPKHRNFSYIISSRRAVFV